MKYRKKPIIVEAIQYDGNNRKELQEFVGLGLHGAKDNMLAIQTLEGLLFAQVGDYIIKGIQGEFYPCKPDIFKETYESYD